MIEPQRLQWTLHASLFGVMILGDVEVELLVLYRVHS